MVEMTMKIVRPDWSREMEIKTWSLGTKLGMILIQSPARDKGTTFLKIEKEIWNWVPSIERTIKLPPSMMMQSWMGSDFTNDDLVKESSIINDYEHNLLGSETLDGNECWKIELVPKPDASVVWGKILTWVSKDEYNTMKSEMYDEDGYLINVLTASNVVNLGGKMLPSRLEVIPIEEPGNKTIMEYRSIDFDVEVKESFFSTQNMKRVR